MELATPTHGRLVVDQPRPAAMNMAIDEVLLENAAEHDELTLRFYGWSEPSVSLGYFQRMTDRDQHTPSLACPLVRRASGGGAIVHDRPLSDLTYSVAVPNVPRRSETQLALYRLFHEAIVLTLGLQGIIAGTCTENEVADPKPFLCFLRHTVGDVLIDGHKVLGSAQRRHAEAVLQHGSVLLSESAAAPELLGIKQLSGVAIESSVLISQWMAQLHECWAVDWLPRELAAEELERAEEKVRLKFGHSGWNSRR